MKIKLFIIILSVCLLLSSFSIKSEKQLLNFEEQNNKLFLMNNSIQLKIAVVGDILMTKEVQLSASKMMNESIREIHDICRISYQIWVGSRH